MTASPSPHRFCVAPMMGCTNRHGRYLLRLLSRRARLYTEMIPIGALLHGDAERALRFDAAEHPVAIQLGGSDAGDLARGARRAERAGYDEVNLNVGCPSPRVQKGCFGAALMARPDLVAACVATMRDAVSIPVTVKTRIGIDDLDSYVRFRDFAGAMAEAGCATFIVHARKAWLHGLSPRQNREVPPLRHDRVFRLKRERPDLEIVLNGGITTLDEARSALRRVDGVMLGRAAWDDLWLLAGVDRTLFGDGGPATGAERGGGALSRLREAPARRRVSGSSSGPSSACTAACRAPAGGAAPSVSSPIAGMRPSMPWPGSVRCSPCTPSPGRARNARTSGRRTDSNSSPDARARRATAAGSAAPGEGRAADQAARAR